MNIEKLEAQLIPFTDAIPQLKHSKKMFGRRNSQYTAQLMTLTMLGDGPYHYMKQCIAQIENKKNALKNTFFNMKKTKYKINKWEKKGDEFSQICIEEARTNLLEFQDDIEHTIREIKMYQEAYDEIAESYGIDETWDEADFLKLEEENHIRMAFRLALRNVIDKGHIESAASEYFEANGIHPIAGERLVTNYYNEMNRMLDEGKAPPLKHFYKFLDKMVETFKGSHTQTMERVGIKNIIREKATLLTHDHEDLNLFLEQHGYDNSRKKLLEENNKKITKY